MAKEKDDISIDEKNQGKFTAWVKKNTVPINLFITTGLNLMPVFLAVPAEYDLFIFFRQDSSSLTFPL